MRRAAGAASLYDRRTDDGADGGADRGPVARRAHAGPAHGGGGLDASARRREAEPLGHWPQRVAHRGAQQRASEAPLVRLRGCAHRDQRVARSGIVPAHLPAAGPAAAASPCAIPAGPEMTVGEPVAEFADVQPFGGGTNERT